MIERFKDLLGKTLSKVEQVGCEELIFTLDSGEQFKLYHEQDCCESVSIDDVVGDLEDLVGSPITMAEAVSSGEDPPGFERKYQNSYSTWTFYRFATAKGYVTIRWCGESNGYYSERVDFARLREDGHWVCLYDSPEEDPLILAAIGAGPEGHPFLESIAAMPGDPAPRLIFADWLEERGRLAAAERIRAAQ